MLSVVLTGTAIHLCGVVASVPNAPSAWVVHAASFSYMHLFRAVELWLAAAGVPSLLWWSPRS